MYRFGEHSMRYGLGLGWWWMIGLAVIFVVLIIWIVMKEINKKTHSNTQLGNKSAHDILDERYAKGEIEKEEFEERKKNLS